MSDKLQYVSELIDKAVLAGLDLGSIQGRTDEEIAATYNGCGPAWFPTLAREKLTKLLGLFEPAFMIHDSDFEHADGSTFDFSQANDRLELNCLKLAAHAYPWYSWRRWRAQAAAIEIASLCRRYGWSAYCSGRGATAAEIHESQFHKLPNSETPSSESNHAKTIPCMLYALALLALAGCHSAPKAKDVSLKGMYGNAATETLAIGSAKITVLPEAIESFVAHYDEDTGWLNSSMKLRRLDIYMTGTNCTASASNVVDSICRTLGELKSAANPDSQAEPDSKEVK